MRFNCVSDCFVVDLGVVNFLPRERSSKNFQHGRGAHPPIWPFHLLLLRLLGQSTALGHIRRPLARTCSCLDSDCLVQLREAAIEARQLPRSQGPLSSSTMLSGQVHPLCPTSRGCCSVLSVVCLLVSDGDHNPQYNSI